MLLMRVDDGQDAALVDGSGVFLPKISMANDARGMHNPDNPSTCLRNNARFGRDWERLPLQDARAGDPRSERRRLVALRAMAF